MTLLRKRNSHFSPSSTNINNLAAGRTVNCVGATILLQFAASNYSVIERPKDCK